MQQPNRLTYKYDCDYSIHFFQQSLTFFFCFSYLALVLVYSSSRFRTPQPKKTKSDYDYHNLALFPSFCLLHYHLFPHIIKKSKDKHAKYFTVSPCFFWCVRFELQK